MSAAVARIRSERWSLLVLGPVAAIAIACVTTHPINLAYDGYAHMTYAELLVHYRHIPTPSESYEFHNPPGFYAIAGGTAVVAERLGVSDEWQVARGLNVFWLLGTLILTLLIARELFPGDRLLQLATLAFAGFVPAVLKMTSMLHPEMLSLFASTLALYLAVRMFARERFGLRPALLLGVVIGLALLVRTFNLWLLPIVLVAFAAAARAGSLPWRRALAEVLIVLAATGVVAGPWFVRQTVKYSNPIVFNRPAPRIDLWRRRPVSFYIGLGLPQSIDKPTRPQFTNKLLPMLYSEIWGDYFGYFAWATTVSGATPVPLDGTRHKELEAQNVLGFIPTLISIGGVLALLWRAMRWRLDPGVLVVVLLPLFGLLGFLGFTVTYPSGDGDVIKAAYVLTTVPGWALGFGYALSRLSASRTALALATAACALALVSDLVFLLHRGPLGPL